MQAILKRLLLVCEDNEVTDKENVARIFKIGLVDEGLHRLNVSGSSDPDQKDPTTL